jgi:2'-5' RNA ligase
VKIGIFIEPPKKKSNFLNNWKKIIKKNFGKQKYLTHPLHSTIATFKLEKKISNNFYISLKNEMKLFSKFKINITKPNIFYDDALTGGDTLFFEIKKNSKLILFQKKILKHFHQIDQNISKDDFFKNKKFQSNYKNFGFPFVGRDWIPHFTIASVNSNFKEKNKIFKNFLSEKNFNKIMDIKNFSIWEINKDKHKKILQFRLK